MSVRVTINASVDTNLSAELQGFLSEKLPVVRSFSGCQRVTVLFDREGKELLLDEDWLSIDQHQAYLASIEANGVLAELMSFFNGEPTIQYFQVAAL